MPRYEVIDPTGDGFFSVIDTKDRTGPFPVKVKNDDGQDVTIQQYQGNTYTLATFSKYLTQLGIQAEAEANTLCNKAQNLAHIMIPPETLATSTVQDLEVTATVKMPETRHVWKNNEDGQPVQVQETSDVFRSVVVARFSQKYCPNAKQEAEALAARLKKTDTVVYSGQL